MTHSINNSIVSTKEIEALKEMIFQRARERAEAMNKELNTSYTSSIKDDVMDLARKSFVAPQNPFSIEKDEQNNETPEIEKENIKGLGFETKNSDAQLSSHFEISTKSEIYSTMAEARQNLDKKSSFIGALNFLNNKAIVEALKHKDKKIDTFA